MIMILRTGDVATRLGITQKKARQLGALGALVVVRVAGHRRFDLGSIERYERQRAAGAAAVTGNDKAPTAVSRAEREIIARRGHEGVEHAILADAYGITVNLVATIVSRWRRRQKIDAPLTLERKAIAERRATAQATGAKFGPFSRERKAVTRGGRCNETSGLLDPPGDWKIETTRCACGITIPTREVERHGGDPMRCALAVRP